jgi:hypothetical protein
MISFFHKWFRQKKKINGRLENWRLVTVFGNTVVVGTVYCDSRFINGTVITSQPVVSIEGTSKVYTVDSCYGLGTVCSSTAEIAVDLTELLANNLVSAVTSTAPSFN